MAKTTITFRNGQRIERREVPIRWATGDEADLRGRVLPVETAENLTDLLAGRGELKETPIPDDAWKCDGCGRVIDERPFAIYNYSQALCRGCRVAKKIGGAQTLLIEEIAT